MRLTLTFTILMVSASLIAAPQQLHQCMGTGHDLGEAIDINALNGKPVSLYGKDKDVTRMVKKSQYIFNHPEGGGPAPLENYGPAGLYRNGKRFRDKKLAENHTDHIHVQFSSSVHHANQVKRHLWNQ